MPRTILHVDMDAFFAAVEQRDDPSLRGKPVLVGGSRTRGVVATASYEARVFGCRSAMPVSQALRLCPHAVVVKGSYAKYRDVSRQVFEIFERFTSQVQPVSVDEAFLDVTGSIRLFGDGPAIARGIREAITRETQLTGSVGVAPNKFLAKLASDLNKPDGLTVITHETVDDILLPLSISRIWGLGPKTAARLARMNVKTIADLRARDDAFFEQFFGSWGPRVRELIHGIDDRPVHNDREAKSIGQEQTFGSDVHDRDTLADVLLGQVEEVAMRLRRNGLLAQGLSLKIRYGDFRTITRARRLPGPTDVTQTIWETAEAALDEWARTSLGPLRLLGVQCNDLTTVGQLPLFDRPREEKLQKLDQAVDRINAKFGRQTVGRTRSQDEIKPRKRSS